MTEAPSPPHGVPGRRTRVSLDDTSRRIITELQQDGRRAYAAIGKAVDLSEAAVRQRVHRLVDAGVIQVVAVVDHERVGLGRKATVGVRAEGELGGLADALARVPEVDRVVVTAGAFDVLVDVVCEDDAHLLRVLDAEIRSLPGVRTTETFVHLHGRDRLTTWGTL